MNTQTETQATEAKIRAEIEALIEGNKEQTKLLKDAKDPEIRKRYFDMLAIGDKLGFALDDLDLDYARSLVD